jgi:hypothetical protein
MKTLEVGNMSASIAFYIRKKISSYNGPVTVTFNLRR